VLAPYNDAEQCQAIIGRHASELAAIIVEPILGAGGYIAGEVEFLRALREASTRHGIVLIFDEVVSSRMALGGMQSLLGIVPDMTTLGKHVGGGCSFGAFGGRADIMRRFDPREPNALYHAGTFNNNRLTMTAGYTAMSEVFTADAVDRLRERGNELRATLTERFARHAVAAQITGFGSVMNIHFTGRRVRRYEDVPADAAPKRLWHLHMLNAGYYCPPRGGILMSLPMTEDQLQGVVAAVDRFLDERAALLDQASTEPTPERFAGARVA
jgi:glutamate-1-semialdehyde 2,1-aminomutase